MAKIVMYADQKAIQFKRALDKAKICYTFDKKPDLYDDLLLHFDVEPYHIDRAVQIKKDLTPQTGHFSKNRIEQLRAGIY